jgi:hypothetical protein
MKLPTLAQVKAELAKRQANPEWTALAGIFASNNKDFATDHDNIYGKGIADDLDDLPELVRYAARLEPRLRRQFLNAIRALREQMDMDALERAMRIQDPHTRIRAVLEALPLDVLPNELASVKDTLQEGFKVGGRIGKEALEESGLRLRFDISNELAEKWAATRSGEMIVEITDSVREGVRDIMERAFSEGRPPRETAKDIRTIVGLTERQTRAVDKFWDELVEDGVPEDKIERRVAKYAEAQLKRRSLVIARTETIRASNEGQQEIWQEAVQEGLLDPARTRRVWMVTDDDRLDKNICEPMDEQMVGLNEPFITGEGEEVMKPPAHPQCRCSTGLVFDKP